MKSKYALFAVLALMTAPKGFSMMNDEQWERDQQIERQIKMDEEIAIAEQERMNNDGADVQLQADDQEKEFKKNFSKLTPEQMVRFLEELGEVLKQQSNDPQGDAMVEEFRKRLENMSVKDNIEESKEENTEENQVKEKKKNNKNNKRQKKKKDEEQKRKKAEEEDALLNRTRDTAKKEREKMLNELEAGMLAEWQHQVNTIFNPASADFDKTHMEISSMLENQDIVLFTPEKISQKTGEYTKHLKSKINAAKGVKKFLEKLINRLKELGGDTTQADETLKQFNHIITRCSKELENADQKIKNNIMAATAEFKIKESKLKNLKKDSE